MPEQLTESRASAVAAEVVAEFEQDMTAEPPAPEAPPPRTPSRGLILAVAVGSLVALIGLWYTSLGSMPGHHAPVAGPPLHHVEYRVSGTGSTADLIYISPAGVLEERSNVALPLEVPITLDMPSGTYVSVTAQARDAHPVSITCTVTVDGRQLSTQQATGHFALANCGTVVP